MAVKTRSHILIPDTQIKPGINLDHIEWIGKYIADRKPDVVVQIGDWWDMPSLSSYDKGTKSFEGRRYALDIAAGNEGMERLWHGMRGMRKKPRMIYTRGNHELRVHRAIESDAMLDGAIGYKDMHLKGWEVHDFLEPVTVDGVTYAHFFPRSGSGAISQNKRGAPTARAQLIREGGSCTAGHQQGLDVACAPLRGHLQWGLIAGSCYRHEESYLTPQGTTYWRGIVQKHEVKDGAYCPMFVSLKYLERRFG